MPRNKFSCDCNAVHSEQVMQTLANMPLESDFVALSDFYKMLADPTRCKILFALLKSEMCVCDLSKLLDMTKSAVSHQLAKMRTNGVVKCRRSGKEVYYSLDDDHIAEIFTVTMEHVGHRMMGVRA